jgi:hypothetical protein
MCESLEAIHLEIAAPDFTAAGALDDRIDLHRPE